MITRPLHLAGIISFGLLLNACSITETVSDILSSTTPGDWYTRDGLPKAEHRVDIFLATNLDNVKADVAQGRGEYVESLGRLFDLQPADQLHFAAMLQDQYPLLADQDRAAVGQIAAAVARQAHH